MQDYLPTFSIFKITTSVLWTFPGGAVRSQMLRSTLFFLSPRSDLSIFTYLRISPGATRTTTSTTLYKPTTKSRVRHPHDYDNGQSSDVSLSLTWVFILFIIFLKFAEN